MAKELNVEDVIERARQAQENRLTAIRGLAEAQQHVTDVREEAARKVTEIERETTRLIAEAERTHVREYTSAQRVGWSPEELKSLGFVEPDKKARVRKRTARKTSRTDVGETASEALEVS